MSTLISQPEYEEQIAATRDARMDWWRKARFGMFIHYGLYAQLGRGEWVMARENIPIPEYEKLAHTFNPRPDAPREWAALAKKAGMKYMVMTTRHHDGFSLWDSKVNPYNSVNYGPGRDIVREFVDACREFGLRVGLYSSMMDWHHPDGGCCAYDTAARARFTRYLYDLNTELLSNYGKIDILWYDGRLPMRHWYGWDSLERNQYLRALQPGIIINNRSMLPEDFDTPEGHITPEERDWEACMTFNDISWGYVDSTQAAPYGYSAQRIIQALNRCTVSGGNLLLNIGPAPDGSVPAEAIAPLTTVGDWLRENGKAVYGKLTKDRYDGRGAFGGNAISRATSDGKSVYIWNWIWPTGGTMGIGGYMDAPRAVRLVRDGTPIDFEHRGHRIILKNLPDKAPDPHAGITVIELVYDEPFRYLFSSYYPQNQNGRDVARDNKL